MCYCLRLVESSTGNERIGGEKQDLETKLVFDGLCGVGLLC
jgi:hypothetical protein